MLDANILAQIAEEARSCFLDEDAPEFLRILKEGIADLRSTFEQDDFTIENLPPIYQELGRAAHSIKGGAGMAEMPVISKLAHKMEDLFEALQNNQ